MNIQIRSAKEAVHELRVRPHHWHLVSLRTPGEDYKAVDRLMHLTYGNIVREFDDIWEPDGRRILPTKGDMQAIFDFVDRSVPVNNLLVHCHAGISRSSAMAYVLACREKEPEEAIKMLNPMLHLPNELMIKFGAEMLDNQKIFDVYKETFDGDPFSSMMG